VSPEAFMGLFFRGVVGGGGGGREGGSERPSGLVLVVLLLVEPGGVGAGVEFVLEVVTALTGSSEGVKLSVASPDGGRVGGGGSCLCGGFRRVVYPSLLWLLLVLVLPLLLLLLLPILLLLVLVLLVLLLM